MSLTACKKYKPLGICLHFSMSALPKTSQRNSGKQTTMAWYSALNITVQHLLIPSAYPWSLLRMCTCNCQSIASTGNKFVITHPFRDTRLLLYPVSWAYQRQPPVQYMPYCTAKMKILGPGKYIAQAGDILHERAIYCTSEQYIAWGEKYRPNCLELGQICPQYSIDCRATILTVGWLLYRKVNTSLMRILYRQQGSKNQWDFVND